MIKIVNFSKSTYDDFLNNKLYKFMTTNLKGTIFYILGFNFFCKNILYNDLVDLFYDKQDEDVRLLIIYINYENERKLTRKILFHLLKNPYKIILKFYLLLSKFFYHKTMKYDSNTIQLLTLIIDREYYKKKISLDLRDKTIDNFHQAYIKKKQATKIIASFQTKNVAAAKYYSRNNFSIFLKNKLYNFIEKKYSNINKY